MCRYVIYMSGSVQICNINMSGSVQWPLRVATMLRCNLTPLTLRPALHIRLTLTLILTLTLTLRPVLHIRTLTLTLTLTLSLALRPVRHIRLCVLGLSNCLVLRKKDSVWCVVCGVV